MQRIRRIKRESLNSSGPTAASRTFTSKANDPSQSNCHNSRSQRTRCQSVCLFPLVGLIGKSKRRTDVLRQPAVLDRRKSSTRGSVRHGWRPDRTENEFALVPASVARARCESGPRRQALFSQTSPRTDIYPPRPASVAYTRFSAVWNSDRKRFQPRLKFPPRRNLQPQKIP